MLCSHTLQASLPFVHLYCPVHSVWPEVWPLLYQWDLLQRNRQERMDKVQDQVPEEMRPVPTREALRAVRWQPEEQGQRFGLSLDTEGFSPEELCVKQRGRRLTVSGKTEKKQEDGKGSYSYRWQQFRQEFDLPQEVNPEAVSCYLAADGKLHIQAAKAPCAEEAERQLTVETQQSVCEHTHGSSTQHTEDKTH